MHIRKYLVFKLLNSFKHFRDVIHGQQSSLNCIKLCNDSIKILKLLEGNQFKNESSSTALFVHINSNVTYV